MKESVILAKYASETRYPGTYEPVSQEEYQKAVRIAQAVVDWAESLILG
ncbi:MAG: HEPN domain-containing protein [bacterium]